MENLNITLKELRKIKHSLPTGSVSRIAEELSIEEQTVRNFFGARKYIQGDIVGWHLQPGPDGGIVNIKDTSILDCANKLINEAQVAPMNN